MDLRTALEILSKSSPYAVSTDRKKDRDYDQYKQQLYVKTPIEDTFSDKLRSLSNGEMLFLCGSSGDGKSELLNRYKHLYEGKIEFRLDATHSFKKNENAIQSLDRLFADFKEKGYPLVIGINTGMLVNYADFGSEKHKDIRDELNSFYKNPNYESAKASFIAFEQFPKFNFDDEETTSSFTKEILSKLTEESETNPFYQVYIDDLGKNKDKLLTTNFKLLSIPEVQDVIIEVLLKARLKRDQFLIARSLLDYIYNILCGDGYLSDNLFKEFDNELSAHIQTLDPTQIRSELFDQFILNFGLSVDNDEFVVFQKSLEDYGVKLVEPSSFIRFFYLFKNHEFSNNFHSQFTPEFEENTLNMYIDIWKLHRDYDGKGLARKQLTKFYSETLRQAINIYVNRTEPQLGNGLYFQKNYNGNILAFEIEIKPNLELIKVNKPRNIGSFYACLIVNGTEAVEPLPININLLGLLNKIIDGYRPNKHDKNTIILLDEVIEHIFRASLKKKSLCIKSETGTYILTQEGADYIEVDEKP